MPSAKPTKKPRDIIASIVEKRKPSKRPHTTFYTTVNVTPRMAALEIMRLLDGIETALTTKSSLVDAHLQQARESITNLWCNLPRGQKHD